MLTFEGETNKDNAIRVPLERSRQAPARVTILGLYLTCILDAVMYFHAPEVERHIKHDLKKTWKQFKTSKAEKIRTQNSKGKEDGKLNMQNVPDFSAVLIFCRISGIDFEEIKKRDYENTSCDLVAIVGAIRSATYMQLFDVFIEVNPLQKVPAIVHGSLKLSESHAILVYLASAFTGIADHWYPTELFRRAKINSVMDWHTLIYEMEQRIFGSMEMEAFCVMVSNHPWQISAWFVNLCNLSSDFFSLTAEAAVVKGGYWYYDSGLDASAIDSSYFTHLFCAFADLASNTNKITLPSSTFSTFTQTVQKKNPSVKTLLSIGGGGGPTLASKFSTMARQDSSCKTFIDN
ncbi:hypothetical protein PIB30_074647 [Stylosanthes scabra]|uniref:Uncharacterized protein n=1 Tax=Stylosanthes scabra TaxID=79078 RepID=A0ABU6ZNG9_9FABA|nr:hypothetical protein [Stylosanthes scabra]